MARALVNKTNVQAADGDYPYGRIKDNPGDNSGTPVNELLYGDIHQFFERLMAKAGVTFNELPDGPYDVFQYYEALELAIFGEDWHVVGSGGGEPAFTNSWSNFNSGTHSNARFKKILDKKVELTGLVAGGVSTSSAFTLPAGYRPSKIITFPAASDGSSAAYVNVNTAGQVTITHTSASFVSLDGMSFPLD